MIATLLSSIGCRLSYLPLLSNACGAIAHNVRAVANISRCFPQLKARIYLGSPRARKPEAETPFQTNR